LHAFFQERLNDECAQSEEGWSEISLHLIPKGTDISIESFRPISISDAVRNTYIRSLLHQIEMDGSLKIPGWQYAYQSGKQCGHVIHMLNTVLVKGAEWGVPVYIVRLDISSAFDSMAYHKLAPALRRAGLSWRWVLALVRELFGTTARVKVANVQSPDLITMTRGGRQGAPETPVLWNVYLADALCDLIADWAEGHTGVNLERWCAKQGKATEHGHNQNPETISLVAWADDLFILGHEREVVQNMLDELVEALCKADLKVKGNKIGILKGKWAPFEVFRVNGELVNTDDTLSCLGTVLQHDGGSSSHITNRCLKTWGAFQRHRQTLMCKHVPLRLRLRYWAGLVSPVLTWGMSAFPLSAESLRRLDGLQMRQLMSMHKCGRRQGEEIGQLRQRLARRVRDNMAKWTVPRVSDITLRGIHGWAGHVMRETGDLQKLVTWRDASWWAHYCDTVRGRVDLRRPCPGRPMRWEDIFVQHCGIDWSTMAADRQQWRNDTQAWISRVSGRGV
jgi:hypothetical protein